MIAALDSPLSDPHESFEKIDNVITLLFTVEAILKIVTVGFYKNGPNSYIISPWNKLDFFIVIISIVEFVLQQSRSVTAIKFLRVARLFRPVRIVATNGSLKSALTSLMNSVPKIIELLTLVVLVLFMFAMLETQLFSGKFYYCYNDHLDNFNYLTTQRLIKHKWDCLNYGGEWIQP